MNYIEKLITANPFPVNGHELNTELIKKYQLAGTLSEKSKCIESLIRINMRVVGIVKGRHARDFSLEMLFSMFYDVVDSAANNYDFKYDVNEKSFLNYMIMKFRGHLGHARRRLASIISTPVNHGNPISVATIDDEICNSLSTTRDDADLPSELDALVSQYLKTHTDPAEKARIKLFTLARSLSKYEIAELPSIHHSARTIDARVAKVTQSLCIFRKFGIGAN